ncbi:hypothetical protein BDP27DRAFT_1319054 [Rhodocollybia butyracea]|uniref:Uncharacterized protein n=1 Tax=Rhodocollybia butyracea TaxID=206335 RepID=A0A9P5Q1U5_9AGAR|nr:hypothetical protein BDP27DRAFT_1319054 [Rhodocollybia butyracea]
MGRPLWSTVYRSPNVETISECPAKWNPNNPFDPDADAFFVNAENEVPITDASTTRLGNLSPFDWTTTSSVERLNSLSDMASERRRELLDVIARRRRSEAIRRAREEIERRRHFESRRVGGRGEEASAQPSTAPAAGFTLSSDRPISPLTPDQLAELQTEPDSDDDIVMRFAEPDIDFIGARIAAFSSAERQSEAVRLSTDTLRAIQDTRSDLELIIRNHRFALLERQAQTQQLAPENSSRRASDTNPSYAVRQRRQSTGTRNHSRSRGSSAPNSSRSTSRPDSATALAQMAARRERHLRHLQERARAYMQNHESRVGEGRELAVDSHRP